MLSLFAASSVRLRLKDPQIWRPSGTADAMALVSDDGCGRQAPRFAHLNDGGRRRSLLCRHMLNGSCSLWTARLPRALCSQGYQPTMLRATSPRTAGVTYVANPQTHGERCSIYGLRLAAAVVALR